ncbi:MAG TPA: SET domain-containing protein-lysine N-methyltransferase [Bryobacteraceae bacterium]|nr:SET domain-containing protein-lysine N-methyltransferase [Bryobacteraceae bacterium]
MALANSAKKPTAERTGSRHATPAKPQIPKIDAQYACFGLKLAPSRIHRWGVYATEFIPSRRKVIEYTGERISRRETKRRAESSDLIYLFTLDKYWAIDGSVGGSGAQFINHSCEPNLVARIVKGHILYMSLRDIRPGEELTLDYHFDKKVEKVPCHCGALKCRGTINVLD